MRVSQNRGEGLLMQSQRTVGGYSAAAEDTFAGRGVVYAHRGIHDSDQRRKDGGIKFIGQIVLGSPQLSGRLLGG